MLQIVDDHHVGGAQLVLEGERVLAIQRAQEMAHEILGAQEQHALAALAEFQRRGVQQVRLAVAEAAVDIEQRQIAAAAFGEGPRRAVAELVGGACYEAVEGLLGVQHPRPQALGRDAVFGFAARQIGNRRGGLRLDAHRLLGDTGADGGRIVRDHDRQGGRFGAFGAEGPLDARHVMVGHPVAYERLGGADAQLVLIGAFQRERSDPGVEHRVSQFAPQPLAHACPYRIPIHCRRLVCVLSHFPYPLLVRPHGTASIF